LPEDAAQQLLDAARRLFSALGGVKFARRRRD
jgi:hypothetical protein